MKYLVILSALLLTACGSGGGSGPADSGTPPGIAPTCKNLYSVWTSKTDSESYDFSALNGVTHPDYSYTAHDGSICGYASNPNHTLTAQLIATPNASSDYQLTMVASLAMSGQCATYVQPSSTGQRTSRAFITMSACGELTICNDYGSCKEFR